MEGLGILILKDMVVGGEGLWQGKQARDQSPSRVPRLGVLASQACSLPPLAPLARCCSFFASAFSA